MNRVHAGGAEGRPTFFKQKQLWNRKHAHPGIHGHSLRYECRLHDTGGARVLCMPTNRPQCRVPSNSELPGNCLGCCALQLKSCA